MFPGPVSEWNQAQVRFCHWMEYYDAIFQSEDCPPDHIIASNYHIDKWVENKIKETKRQREELRRGRKGHRGRSAYDHDMVVTYGD